MRDMADVSEGRVRILPGTLYSTLKKLLAEGLIEECPAPRDADSNDARRRYYRVTKKGRITAEAETRRLSALVRLAAACSRDDRARRGSTLSGCHSAIAEGLSRRLRRGHGDVIRRAARGRTRESRTMGGVAAVAARDRRRGWDGAPGTAEHSRAGLEWWAHGRRRVCLAIVAQGNGVSR